MRLHGRLPGHALDCVGLAVHAWGLRAHAGALPSDYCLRADNRERLARGLAALGFRKVPAGQAGAGDLAEFIVARGAHHLAVLADATIIHADFSVRRVVEVHAPASWRVAACWRREGGS